MRRATSATRVRRERSARLCAVVCAGVLTFGMYGMSGVAVAKAQPTVSIGTVKGIGTVLVDSNGHALYTLVNNHQSVECTGACLTMGFVPLTVAPGKKPTAGKGVKGLGLVPGGTQVTENNFPLFLFTADKTHQAKGQGLTSSGGTWHAPTVKVAKQKKKGGSNAGTGGVSF
jgi:predicted lipoprotein with Yx(FWY)xxD motif